MRTQKLIGKPNMFQEQWSRVEMEGVKAILSEWMTEEMGTKVDAERFLDLAYLSHDTAGLYSNSFDYGVDDGFYLKAVHLINHEIVVLYCLNYDGDEAYYVLE